MYRFLFCCLFFTNSLFCQRNNFAIGFQSGNNISQTVVITEFDNSPLNGDYFIGSSFGLIARSKLFSYKWQWGGFSQKLHTYLEYGATASYGGYNYRFENQTTFQEQLTISVPMLIVIRPAYHKYWYKNFKGKRIYPIVKGGFNFSKITTQHNQNNYIFGETELIEDIQMNPKINMAFVGALGMQKEFKNGRILYIGFSSHTPLVARAKGTITVNSPQINEIARLSKQGNIYSIDLQYFIGKRVSPKRRKKRWGKLPKIIYNPRYL